MNRARAFGCRWARVILLLRWAFGLGVLAVVLATTDFAALSQSMRAVAWWPAGLAIAGLVLVHGLGAVAWRRLAEGLGGMTLGLGFAFRSYYAGQAVGSLTPGNVGSEAYRAAALRPTAHGWRQTLIPVAVQRLASTFAVGLLAAGGALWMPAAPVTRIVAVAAPFVMVVAVALVVSGAARTRWVSGIRAGLGEAPGRAIRDAVILSVLSHLCASGLAFVLIISTGERVPMGPAFASLAIARLATVLPLTPGGLGVQEAAFVLLLPDAGLSVEGAVTVSALNRLAFLVTVAVGLVCIVAGQGRPPEPEEVPRGPDARAAGNAPASQSAWRP
jgi:uncharacterized membrane protein YbhN (UPF0104 family)